MFVNGKQFFSLLFADIDGIVSIDSKRRVCVHRSIYGCIIGYAFNRSLVAWTNTKISSELLCSKSDPKSDANENKQE